MFHDSRLSGKCATRKKRREISAPHARRGADNRTSSGPRLTRSGLPLVELLLVLLHRHLERRMTEALQVLAPT